MPRPLDTAGRTGAASLPLTETRTPATNFTVIRLKRDVLALAAQIEGQQ